MSEKTKTLRDLLIDRQNIADARRKARDMRSPCEEAANNAHAIYISLADAEVAASEAMQAAFVDAIEALTARMIAMEQAAAMEVLR